MANTSTTAYRWSNWLNLILAVWLFVSPWALGYAELKMPAWNAWVVAVVVGTLSVAAIAELAVWEDWVSLALGVWLFLSPWLLGFADVAENAAFNAYVIGAIFVALAAWGIWAARSAMMRARVYHSDPGAPGAGAR